jgi:endonuclease YncB( thermonuclease family)
LKNGVSPLTRLLLVALMGASPAWANEAPPARPRDPAAACPREEAVGRIEAVDPDGTILVAGRRLRLEGVRLVPEVAAAARDLLVRHLGAEVNLTLAAAPDRWGRHAARVIRGGPEPLDLAHGLLEEGLALVDPGPLDILCRPELLALEETARARRLGLWAGSGYNPAAASDLEGLRGRIGRFSLVEGVVRSVGERPQRTYLNFGPDWGTDFTVTIPKRLWGRMQERGITAASLRGRRLRVRGLIEEWRGPSLELSAAELLELLDQAPPRPR